MQQITYAKCATDDFVLGVGVLDFFIKEKSMARPARASDATTQVAINIAVATQV
ncbi:MAG: hypothetical protein LPK09_06050 [Hymenobacteraceae bacterium]|nr:hypothetical protein [Hymenobacteraceae bacterium]